MKAKTTVDLDNDKNLQLMNDHTAEQLEEDLFTTKCKICNGRGCPSCKSNGWLKD